MLPLKPTLLTSTDYSSNHNATLTVSGASLYDAGTSSWNILINPTGTVDFRNISGSVGVFSVDISLASSYDIIITDTNGSQTTTTLNVVPNTIDSNLYSGTSYIADFCNANSSDVRCPDGASLIATVLDQVPPTGIFANKIDSYSLTFRPRDTY